MARFKSKPISNQLRTAMEKKVEAKSVPTLDSIGIRPHRHLWRAFGFVIGIGFTTFSCAAVFQHKRTRDHFRSLIEEFFTDFDQAFRGGPIAAGPFSHSVISTLLLLNIGVYFLWFFKPMHPFLYRYLTTSFASKSLCWPMLFSVFSHMFFFHLFANMYVLSSFAPAASRLMGLEEFTAFYLTSGVFASFTSLLWKSILRSPARSLGASGAISALIGYICSVAPESRLQIIFLPYFNFSAREAIYGILLFEFALLMVGAFTRFSMFDNAAHLGGLIFGMMYANGGEQFYRRHFMPTVAKSWLKFRGADPSYSSTNVEKPVLVFDGMRHVHTGLDNLQGTEEGGKGQKELVKQMRLKEKLKAREQLHREWEHYRKDNLEAQKEKKRRVLERRQINQPAEWEEDGEEGVEPDDRQPPRS